MPARSGWKSNRSEPNSAVSEVVFRLEKSEPSIRLGFQASLWDASAVSDIYPPLTGGLPSA